MQESILTTAVLSLVMLLTPVALQADDPASEMPESSAAEAVSEEPAATEGEADTNIMDQPLDGSSEDSFTQGLALVESEAPVAEYRMLKAALDRMLFYDIAAKRDKAVLYKKLNGKSPNEIIEQAKPKKK